MSLLDSSELAGATCLYSFAQIDNALTTLAQAITAEYCTTHSNASSESVLVIGVMTGAIVVMGHLLPKLDIPIEVDYIHVSRYGDKLQGEQLNWLAYPKQPLNGRSILLIDDIFDEGVTLQAVTRYCYEQGAHTVKSCVLLDKQHPRKVSHYSVDYTALHVVDRYVFGFGLDHANRYRNLPGIYALPDTTAT